MENYRWLNWDNALGSFFFTAAVVFAVFIFQACWAEKNVDRYVLEFSSNEIKIVSEIDWAPDADIGVLGVINRDITMEDAIRYVNLLNDSLKIAK